MTTSSLRKQLRQFLSLTADLGAADGARLVLRELGIRTYITTVYPGLPRQFRVQFDPVWRWVQRGERETGLLRFAEDCIRPGESVLDVGAHLGESGLLFSELVGASGRVVAFEPDPVARSSLERNLELNRISNVAVEVESVSDREGTVTLATERLGSGADSIVRAGHRASNGKELEVPSTTIDSYCGGHALAPDWIKIDAEGAEPLIVKGMQRTIEKHHPSVILEFHAQGLSGDQRSASWSAITARASSVKVLDIIPSSHGYLEELSRDGPPECDFLIVYLKY